MKKKIISIVAFLIISSIFLTGCDQKTNGENIDLSKLEVLNNFTVTIREDLTGEEYREIKGYIRNNAGKGFELIRVNISFYDKNGILIITKPSDIINIANKETKKFSTVYHSLSNNYYQIDWDNIGFEISIIKD
jgi:hypothetical protein